MNDDVRLPEVEVRVTAGSWDVLVVAFYASRDIHAPYEAVSSVAGAADRQALVQVLSDCIALLKSEGWVTVDELDTRSSENEERPPF